jgi:hypothetical protein
MQGMCKTKSRKLISVKELRKEHRKKKTKKKRESEVKE